MPNCAAKVKELKRQVSSLMDEKKESAKQTTLTTGKLLNAEGKIAALEAAIAESSSEVANAKLQEETRAEDG